MIDLYRTHPVLEIERNGYRISTDRAQLDLNTIHDFLACESYWAKGIPRSRMADAIANSLCFGLYNRGGRQVGFARVVTDMATFAYLCDVFVVDAERRNGLGKWLMETVCAHPALVCVRRFMLATRDAHALYAQYGFQLLQAPERFMEIHRPDIYRVVANNAADG